MFGAISSAKLYIGGAMLAVIVSMGVWLAIEKANHGRTKAVLEATETRLAVSNSSIETLLGSIGELREQALQRAALLESARAQASRDAERFARDRQALEARNRRLTALVRPRDGLCPADEEVLDALDSL